MEFTTITLARHSRRGYHNLKDCLAYACERSQAKQEPMYVLQVNTFWQTVFCVVQCKSFDGQEGLWPVSTIIRALVVGEDFNYV